MTAKWSDVKRRLGVPEPGSVKAILAAPANYNRKTRRSIGLFGRFWKWDMNNTELQRTFVPRYIRRHFVADRPHFEGQPKLTRRQRRHRARIIAISRRAGLI